MHTIMMIGTPTYIAIQCYRSCIAMRAVRRRVSLSDRSFVYTPLDGWKSVQSCTGQQTEVICSRGDIWQASIQRAAGPATRNSVPVVEILRQLETLNVLKSKLETVMLTKSPRIICIGLLALSAYHAFAIYI